MVDMPAKGEVFRSAGYSKKPYGPPIMCREPPQWRTAGCRQTRIPFENRIVQVTVSPTKRRSLFFRVPHVLFLLHFPSCRLYHAYVLIDPRPRMIAEHLRQYGVNSRGRYVEYSSYEHSDHSHEYSVLTTRSRSPGRRCRSRWCDQHFQNVETSPLMCYEQNPPRQDRKRSSRHGHSSS